MHVTHIYIHQAPHNITNTLIPSQFYFFTHSTKLTHQSTRLLSSESSISAVSSANSSWFILDLIPFAFSCFGPFLHAIIYLSHHTIIMYIKLQWRHHTTLSQSNINQRPLTHIYFYLDTCHTIYLKTLHCFQQFSLSSIHS